MKRKTSVRVLGLWVGVLGLTWLVSAVWLMVVPPWGAPDEPGHFLYARLYATLGRMPRVEDDRRTLWAEVLRSLEATHWQAYVRPEGPPVGLEEDPTLAASGLQVGQKPPGYYALAAAWLRWRPDWDALDVAAQLRWLRWLSVGLRVGTAAVALGLARRLWPQDLWRALGVGGLVGLWPMAGFIGSSVNNDGLTMLWGALGFAGLVLVRSAVGWVWVVVWLLVGGVVVDAGLLYLWPLMGMRALFFAWDGHRLRLRVRPGWQGVMLAGLVLGLVLVLPQPRWAAGWRRDGTGVSREAGTLYLDAEGGSVQVRQIRSGLLVLRRAGEEVVLRAQVRGRDGEVHLWVRDEDGGAEGMCPTGDDWTECEVRYRLAAGAHGLRVGARLDQGKAWLRLSLRDDEGWELLINGQGRWPGVWGDPLFTWLERKLPLPAGYFSQLLLGSVWDVPSLIRYGVYLGLAWVGFWGWFGWLTRPWPWWVYGGAAVVSVLAMWGIVRRLISGRAGARALGLSSQEGTDGAREGHGAEDGGIVLFALAAVGWMGVLVVLPMLGQDWQPQGRYVFPALVPLAVLMWMGWEVWVPRRWRGWLGVGVMVGLLVLNGLGWWVV